MKINDITIKDAMDSINKDYYVPIFQRQLQWSLNDITKLFDSIMKDYYIGSLLFWSIEPEKSDGLICYKFIENYISGEVYPDDLNGQHRSDLLTIEDPKRDKTLVIDGQQRLNSLYLGLCSNVLVNQKGSPRKDAETWDKKSLYIDLNTNPLKQDDSESFNFTFRTQGGVHGKEYWYKVSNIMSVQDIIQESDQIREDAKQEGLNEFESEIIESTLDRLHKKIFSDKVLAYYNLEDQKHSEMHEIFIRINESGSQLSNSDQLLSKITPLWHTQESLLPREEFNRFSDKINNNIDEIMGSYIMKPEEVITFLYDLEDFGTSLRNFSEQDHLSALQNWKKEYVQDAFLQTCKILREYSLTHNVFNKVDRRLLIYCIANRKMKDLPITQAFKEDLLDLIIITHTKNNLRTSYISNIKNINNIETIPFKKIDSKIETGLRFDTEGVVESIHKKTATRQLLLLRLFDKDIRPNTNYSYKFREKQNSSPSHKSILNRDYQSGNNNTQIVSNIDEQIEKEREKLKSDIEDKFKELLN
jgi:uncharacterized protein with ParB-like and HNH nuclease domain